MPIRYARSALFCPKDTESFFGEELWELYKAKQISYEGLCNVIRNKMSEKVKQKEMCDLIEKWNPLLASMLSKTDLRLINKKNNDIIKSIFSYIYRSTYNAEYGNGYGYASRVNNSCLLYEKNPVISYRFSRYSAFDNLYANPSISYDGDYLYYFAEKEGKECIRKIALDFEKYSEIENDFKKIPVLDYQKKMTYQKIGLILKEKNYEQLLDVTNNEKINFDVNKYHLAISQARSFLSKNLVRFPAEKQRIIKLLLEDFKKKGQSNINLVEFVCSHFHEILDIRSNRNWDVDESYIETNGVCDESALVEFYFSPLSENGKYSGKIKIENASPIIIFSSRMDAIFGEKTSLSSRWIPISFNPFQNNLYHTTRLSEVDDISKLGINIPIKENDIGIGDITLSTDGNRIITQYRGKEIIPAYLSTYNVSNSLLLIFLRMISYIQEEIYYPNFVLEQETDKVVCQKEIIVDNVMISARKWSIPTRMLPRCKKGIFSSNEYEVLQKIVLENNIPRFIKAYSNEKNTKRVIDLYNPFSCIQLKKYYDESYVVFEEITHTDMNVHLTQYLWEPEYSIRSKRCI